ncbi:mobilization protein, partial [Listeria monocytogenes]|nr:mobilization protein [Listeria monocytogenes]
MSVKTLDGKGRWRNKIVAFRVSPEENEHLNKLVKLSGLNKQEYLIHRILMEEIT